MAVRTSTKSCASYDSHNVVNLKFHVILSCASYDSHNVVNLKFHVIFSG